MADNNNEEKLKITAELDTSKLKQQAQQGSDSVKRSFKELDRQANNTYDEIMRLAKGINDMLDNTSRSADNAVTSLGKVAQAVEQINNRQMLRALGGLAKQLVPVAKEAMADFGIPEEAGEATGNIISHGFTGARAGAAFGPMGVAVGALTGAGSALLTAGYELQKAAVKQGEVAVNQAKDSLDRYNEFKNDKAFTEMVGRGDRTELSNARDDLAKQQAQLEKVMSFRAKMTEMGITNTEDAVKILKQKGFWDKSWDTITGQAGADSGATTGHANSLVEMAKSLDDAMKRYATITSKLSTLDRTISGIDRATERDADKEAKAKAKAEAEAVKEALARAKAFDTYTIEQKREKIADIQNSQLKPLESLMSGMSNVKLTDSLTQIGGGSGYGVQMQGINRYVSSISNNIQTIKGIIQQELDAIRELSNKYKPYYGEFMAQQDN